MATTSGSTSGPKSLDSVSSWSSSFIVCVMEVLASFAKEERPGAIVLKNAFVMVGNFRLRPVVAFTGGFCGVTVISGMG